MEREQFERLVSKALAGLNEEFRSKLENVAIGVQNWPTLDQLATVGLRYRTELLGLYEGVPLTARGVHYNLVSPDRITVFQKPVEAVCDTDEEIEEEIRSVLYHEIAHHFGIGDERLEELEAQDDWAQR